MGAFRCYVHSMVTFPLHVLQGAAREEYDRDSARVREMFKDPRLQEAHDAEVFRRVAVMKCQFGMSEIQVRLARQEHACRSDRQQEFACDSLVLDGATCNPDCPAAKV